MAKNPVKTGDRNPSTLKYYAVAVTKFLMFLLHRENPTKYGLDNLSWKTLINMAKDKIDYEIEVADTNSILAHLIATGNNP